MGFEYVIAKFILSLGFAKPESTVFSNVILALGEKLSSVLAIEGRVIDNARIKKKGRIK